MSLNLIVEGVEEIVQNTMLMASIFDDYFYPTTE
jgi:hypothetical protein